MEKLSREKLIRLAIIIAVLMVMLIIFANLFYKKETTTDKEVQEAIYKNAVLLNNNDRIIQYGNEVFYISNFKDSSIAPFVVASIPADFDEEGGIKNPLIIATQKMANSSSKLFLYNNCLYYTYIDNTYEYNLLTKVMRTFCEGELQYINDNYFVSLDDGDLYKGEYYPTTHSVKSLQNLTTASNMTRLCEDDDMIFYESRASDEIRLVIGLNKSNYNLKIYYRYDVTEYNLSSAISNDNSLTLLVQSERGIMSESGTYNKPFTLISIKKKDLSKTENMLENKYENGEILYMSNNKENIPVCKLTLDDDTNETYKLNPNTLKLSEYDEKIDKYEIKPEKNEVVILENGKEITRYTSKFESIENAYLPDVYKVGDYIYFDISVYGYLDDTLEDAEKTSSEYELVLLRANKNGGKAYKINQRNINIASE